MSSPFESTVTAPYDAPYAAPEESFAAWWRRVVAVVLDTLLQLPFVVAGLIGMTVAVDASGLVTQLIGLAIGAGSYFGSLVFAIWNSFVRQGRRGASLGKECVGILVVSAETARPIGGILTFVRSWAHVLDYLPLGLGFLWPLWDRRRQTFADKLMNTVVLHLPDVRF